MDSNEKYTFIDKLEKVRKGASTDEAKRKAECAENIVKEYFAFRFAELMKSKEGLEKG